MRVFRLIIIFCIVLLSASAHAQQYNFETISIEDGLPQAGVYDITQDRKGNLWVATEGGGACKYNGIDFEIIGLEEGLLDNAIRCVYEDSKGNIWLGTQNAGLAKYHKGTITNYSIGKGFPVKHVRSVVEANNGTIWVGTLNEGLAKFDDEKFTFLTTKDGLPSNSIRYSVKDKKGIIWFCTDGGIAKLKEEKLSYYNIENGLSHNKVLTAYVNLEGDVWFGTSKGITIEKNGTFTSLEVPEIIDERVRAISQDIFGNYWVGTQEGLLRLAADTAGTGGYSVKKYTRNNGLSNDRVRTIFRDRSGAVWIGTYFGGICKYTGEEFILYNEKDGFPEENITAMDYTPNGDFLLGTFEGNIFQFSNSKEVNVLYTSHEDNQINAITTRQDEIWAATAAEGLLKIRNGVITKYNEFGGRFITNFQDLVLSGDTVFSVNESGLLLFNSKTSEAERVPLSKGYASGTVIKLYNNQLYIGSTNGLFIADVSDPKNAIRKEGIKGKVTDITMDSKKNIWVATGGEGLFKINFKKEVSLFTKNNGITSNYIKSLVLDSLENIWLGYHRGIELVELDPTQSFVLSTVFYDQHDGFSGTETNYRAAALDKTGAVWLGTIRGLSKYSHNQQYAPATPPITSIKKIKLFYEEVDWKDKAKSINEETGLPVDLVLNYKNNHLTFKFVGIDLLHPEKVRYEYILEGYEEKWSSISAITEVTYPSLPAGDYTFKVKARSSNDLWNEKPTTFSFTITPPFYKETWFLILAGLLVGGIVYLVITIRIRVLKSQKKALEEKVKERTYQLNVEKQETEKLLLNILPKSTADELKKNGTAKSKKHEETTVLFSDFKGFTQLTENLSPTDLVAFLDDCFQGFDAHAETFGVEKIKTIGDAYMCATGLPEPDEHHAENMVLFAQKMLEVMEKVNKQHLGQGTLEVRIGIHSGSLVSGVVGKKKFAYDVWGDTVNIAARMESSGEPNQINISEATYEMVKDKFKCTPRGKVKAKNKGELEMYFVEGFNP